MILGVFNLVVALCPGSSFAFSGGSGDPPTSGPPQGRALSVSENAPGIKLVGEMIIEYVNFDDNTKTADMARVILRLNKGKNTNDPDDLKIFYGEISGELELLEPELEPSEVQDFIKEEMESRVLAAFFPDDTDLGTTVKYLSPQPWTTVLGTAFLPRDAITPGYLNCEWVKACTRYGELECEGGPDGAPPGLWIEILSCDGNYEFCGNGVDDDHDGRPDTTMYPLLNDPDCYKVSGFTVFKIVIAVK